MPSPFFMEEYAFIGDIHSDYSNLMNLLDRIDSRYHLVFLGDLFDYRVPNGRHSDSLKVYHTLRQLHSRKKATILRSNHQDKFERYLTGNPVEVSSCFALTLSELEGIPAHQMYRWLSSFPYGLTLHTDREYRLAHAYYPTTLSSDNEHYPDKSTRRTMIYGLHRKKERIEWWREEEERDFVRVAGHYHEVYVDDKSIVLDAQCGSTPQGQAVAYLTDSRSLVYSESRLISFA